MDTPATSHHGVPDPQAAWTLELQELLLATDSVAQFLHQVAVLAARTTAPGLSCGLTLGSDGNAATVASSDDLALSVDEIQYSTGTGPCLDSMRSGEVIHVVDFLGETRWPQFTDNALAQGVRCSLSLPLAAAHGVAGALNIYAPYPDAFSPAAQQRARIFAATAAGAVAVAQRMADQAELSQDLRVALANRSIIDQAIGILMSQNRLTAEKAFDVLRRTSQNRNIKLRDVAARLIESVTGAPPAGQANFQPRE
jgi:GAF domain-containing protein